MIPVTFDPICTASPCIEQTEICSISFIQKIGCCVPSIEFRIASGFGCLFFFFVLSTNVLAVPIVIFLISFLVGVFVGDTGLDLLPSRGFTDARKLQIFLLLFLSILLRYVAINIEFRFTSGTQGPKIILNSNMKLFRQLPDRLASLGVEVVVALTLFVVVNLEGLDQFVDFLCVHSL